MERVDFRLSVHLRLAGARDHAILLEISGHILRPDETAEQKCCRAARNARRHAAPARCSRRALRTCWSEGGPGPFPRVRQEQRRKAPERGGTSVDRKSTSLNSSHKCASRMTSSAGKKKRQQ